VIAATATIIERSRPSVLGHPAIVYILSEIEWILKQHATQALFPQRAHCYDLMNLNADNTPLKRCNVLNPATLLPAPSRGDLHHDCAQEVFHSSCLWDYLQDQPLGNTDLILFTDGSLYHVDGK